MLPVDHFIDDKYFKLLKNELSVNLLHTCCSTTRANLSPFCLADEIICTVNNMKLIFRLRNRHNISDIKSQKPVGFLVLECTSYRTHLTNHVNDSFSGTYSYSCISNIFPFFHEFPLTRWLQDTGKNFEILEKVLVAKRLWNFSQHSMNKYHTLRFSPQK